MNPTNSDSGRRIRKLGAGRYGFDDLEVGDWYETGTAEVGQERIQQFAELTGDRFAVHTDDRFARELGFPARIAHGLLVISMADGLKFSSKVELDAVASLGWNLTFSAPVFAGDEIAALIRVESKRATRNPRRGVVSFAMKILNQDGQVVQRGSNLLMMRRNAGLNEKPESAGAGAT